MTPTEGEATASGMTLREPAHQPAPQAVRYWVVNGLIGAVVGWAVMFAIYWFVPDSWQRWLGPIFILVMAFSVLDVTAEPIIRYRRTRWEVTPHAVYAQSGWLSREQRIAPLSRVQTVDTHRGAVMRLFGLANVTVTTASAAGPITLACLETHVADRVTAELARITGQTEGDAT